MTAAAILKELARGGPVGGRHVLVTAHPDDETVSASALLCRLAWAPVLVQITDGTQSTDPDRVGMALRRAMERTDALAAGRWDGITVIDAGCPGREAHRHVPDLVRILRLALAGATAVWTHPYEHGHLDHDTASLAVAAAVGPMAEPPAVLEFASYFMDGAGRSVFGDFWPHGGATPTAHVELRPEELRRKRAAVDAYASQAAILRKFPQPGSERYRVSPGYDHSAPARVPLARWDAKGYRPTTAEWRALTQEATR